MVGSGIEAVKVVASPGGGFLFITRENGAEFDVWIETLAEVHEELAQLSVNWGDVAEVED